MRYEAITEYDSFEAFNCIDRCEGPPLPTYPDPDSSLARVLKLEDPLERRIADKDVVALVLGLIPAVRVR